MELRNQSNIEWCEAVTHPHVYSPFVAEFYNTWSNLIFILVGLLGIIRVKHNNNNSFQNGTTAHLFTDGMIIMVGLGSMWFHSQRTYVGEILDELPMSIMAFGYMLCLDGLHWLTSGSNRNITFLVMFLILIAGWAFYIIWDSHEIFTTLFTIQIIVPILISFDSSIAGNSRSLWYATLVAILTGKLIWEYERHLYRNNRCPQSQLTFSFWCHPLWHLLSASSHFFWIKYITEVPQRKVSLHVNKDA